ncbi:LIM and calponin -likey domains-containing protein 1 [Asbolus verrucosus]|uniref:LIM and calponin-likey domains-containing protein 1 n=1 Tax=Asbolus verrucosus TaxID=1661398 RepID=A0A482VT13_ASBVE|nr:LIM and calponin -likey domains-containing protein 1 [Asbolus verrucosus]
MDNNNEYENPESMNSNTEYLPTKCRITKPPPPKPAANPLQFVKVAPCPLFQKAHEQIKKVEEIKKERKEVREEAEDWQQNLDNWKSCRRKRQEHIIERVVEVKKMEQEEQERHRKKSKTFNEMIENRSKGRHKFSIPIYDDDSNDLSDYGIGSSSSKTNSIKDVDTDDSCSILDEKENRSFESPCNKDNSSASNQSQSEDETNTTRKDNTRSSLNVIKQSTFYTSTKINDSKFSNDKPENTEQYTYEGAIQDYRSRIRSKIHVDESIFTKSQDYTKSKEFSEAQSALPKGEIFKRKELFETDKPLEINNYESPTARRLSEDFVNTQSIKQRLQSLEKCTDQSLRNDKNDIQTIKQRLQNFNKQNDDSKNNNKTRSTKISSYLINKSNTTNLEIKNNNTNLEWKKKDLTDRCSSPETELYMDNLKMFSRDLDNLMQIKSSNRINNIDDYCVNLNYPASTSSTELMGISSDREDSGIHTADVSCSVSQADEPVEDTELAASTIPSCIEKLTIEERNEFDEIPQNENDVNYVTTTELEIGDKDEPVNETNNKNITECTIHLLESLRRDSSDNLWAEKNVPCKPKNHPKEENIYENVKLFDNKNTNPIEFISDDIVIDGTFPLAPPTMIEPPKVKPPPPPPVENDNVEISEPEMKRINSTKRIKREIHIKRSSFLGLDEPTEDQIYPEISVDRPPDINSFLQKESKLEKSLYKKAQEENRIGILSKVESHDSGLDIDRGRLSSDTWCSSIGDSNTPSPERHDSEQTNSITSEEDEITKKEREIIEMVEKEEKSRDIVDYLGPNEKQNQVILRNNQNTLLNEPYLGSENFNNPYFPKEPSNYLDDQDSEVLKVEHELRQLEREELKRQHENMLFQESRAKARLQNNRHSSENIFDEMYSPYQDGVNYRKSMPELQHIPLEYRKSLTDVPNAYNVYRSVELDVQYRKSMPDIQHAYHKSIPEYHKPTADNSLDHRKSMPDIERSAFKSPPPVKRQPILPGKPIRPMSKEQRDRYLLMNPALSDPLQHPNGKPRQLSRHSLQALSAVPKSRHLPVDWIQPRSNPEKNTKQHWLIQEAELRRISEQKNAAANRNWQQPRQEKHLPDSVIQTLTQRAQNRAEITERNQPIRRSETSPNKDSIQHPYLGHNQTMGHALPMPYPPPVAMEETQDRMLSVSGKKKCSNCNKELGRGAAMIIESLCLFYHMECFICCVCHMQLGDGRMGTDVRVRNQKLHCHNCYSSDDGIKFSCV